MVALLVKLGMIRIPFFDNLRYTNNSRNFAIAMIEETLVPNLHLVTHKIACLETKGQKLVLHKPLLASTEFRYAGSQQMVEFVRQWPRARVSVNTPGSS